MPMVLACRACGWSVLILSVLMIASFAGDCRAQDQPVQQGVADVDPLLESLRTYSPSLRQDNNYQHVYILDRNDPNSPFFRRAGGSTPSSRDLNMS